MKLKVKVKVKGKSKKLEVNGGLGTIFSRISIEAPILKDKASFLKVFGQNINKPTFEQNRLNKKL